MRYVRFLNLVQFLSKKNINNERKMKINQLKVFMLFYFSKYIGVCFQNIILEN